MGYAWIPVTSNQQHVALVLWSKSHAVAAVVRVLVDKAVSGSCSPGAAVPKTSTFVEQGLDSSSTRLPFFGERMVVMGSRSYQMAMLFLTVL